MPYHVIVRYIDFRKHFRKTFNRSFLIGLAGTKPNIPYQNITNNKFIHFQKKRTSWLLRWQEDQPIPLRISFSIIMLSTKTYGYFLSGRSPAPYFQFRITLQHHFVTYQTRKSDFSRKRQRSRTNQQNKANNKKYSFHNLY